MSAGATLVARLQDRAGRVYGALPQSVVDVLGLGHPLLALLAGVRLPVAIARGRYAEANEHASMLLAGTALDLDYFVNRFFTGPIELEPRGSVSLARMPGYLRQLRDDCDLTLARVDRISSRGLFGREYLRLPDWLGTLMLVPADLERYVHTPQRLWSDIRVIRRNELRWHVSHAPADFERFYYRMYLPFARRRHGPLAVERNVHQLRRVFRAGCLLWVTQRARPISAILLTVREKVLRFVVLGTDQGSLEPVHLGGLAALYLFSLEYAVEQKLMAVDFGGLRPCLTDGVVRYKQKWGVRLTSKPDVHHEFLFYWPRLNPAVTSFLASHPPVCRYGRTLFGLASPSRNERDAGNLVDLHSRIWIDGLQRVFVLGADGDVRSAPAGFSGLAHDGRLDWGSEAIGQAVADDLRSAPW